METSGHSNMLQTVGGRAWASISFCWFPPSQTNAITYILTPILTTDSTPNYHLPSTTISQAHPQLQRCRYLKTRKGRQLPPLPHSEYYNQTGLRQLLCVCVFACSHIRMWIVHSTRGTQDASSYLAVKHVQSLAQVCPIEIKKKKYIWVQWASPVWSPHPCCTMSWENESWRVGRALPLRIIPGCN